MGVIGGKPLGIARESAFVSLEDAEPPKEQPPRNLSGQRTARARDTLESAPAKAGATEGVTSDKHLGESSQVP